MIKAYLCTPHTNLFCRKGNVTLREIMLVAQGRTEENLKDRIWMGSESPAPILTTALYKMYLIFIMNELTLKISDPHSGSLSQALFFALLHFLSHPLNPSQRCHYLPPYIPAAIRV